MSGYGEMARAAEVAAIVRQYGPKELPELTEENLRWNIARANQAEAELAEIRKALRVLKRAVQ